VQPAGNNEPIPFNRVGDAGHVGRDRVQVAEGLPSLRVAVGRVIELRMMRTADFSGALIFGGLRWLLRRFGETTIPNCRTAKLAGQM
jgi:hypothetical protein